MENEKYIKHKTEIVRWIYLENWDKIHACILNWFSA